MNAQKPLSAFEKVETAFFWNRATPRMKHATFSVLVALLKRQNSRTGRCDPSVEQLTRDTNFCRRAVQNALKELTLRGALRIDKRRGRSNAYHLQCCTEIIKKSGAQSRSQRGADLCAQPAQRDAPKIEKEKEKKNGKTRKTVHHHGQDSQADARRENREKQAFEQGVAQEFERIGLGYEDLLNIPLGLIEEVFVWHKTSHASLSECAVRLAYVLHEGLHK